MPAPLPPLAWLRAWLVACCSLTIALFPGTVPAAAATDPAATGTGPTPALVTDTPGTAAAVSLPRNTRRPALHGYAQAGEEVSTTDGRWSWDSGTLTYGWLRCDANGDACLAIAGETASRYSPGASDVGHRLRSVVTATNAAGSSPATSASSAVVVQMGPPRVLAAPALASGPLSIGQVLHATTGTWRNAADFAWTWMQCDVHGGACLEFEGADTVTVLPTDGGLTFRLLVRATGPGGSTDYLTGQTAAVPTMLPHGPASNAPAPEAPDPREPDTPKPTVVTVTAPSVARVQAALRRGVRATVRSSQRATVTVQVRLAAKVARTLRLPRTVGTARATAGAGKATGVSVRLTARARRTLATQRRIRLTLVLTVVDPSGTSMRRNRAVTLRG